MKPILKYSGGKYKEIDKIIKYIPLTYNRYIEPFFGGGALFFHLKPKMAIINDKNTRLIRFYSEISTRYQEVREQLDKLQDIFEKNQKEFIFRKIQTPNQHIQNENKELYYQMRRYFNRNDGEYLDSVVYYFINKLAYSGMIRYNKQGEFNVPFGHYSNFNTKLLTNEHVKLLQNTKIYSLDYSYIFDMVKENDFVFLDPPYDCKFTQYGNLDTLNGFDEFEHRRLAAKFKELPCEAVMVIGKTPLIEELYGDMIVTEYPRNYSINIRNRFSSNVIHVIVKNSR